MEEQANEEERYLCHINRTAARAAGTLHLCWARAVQDR